MIFFINQQNHNNYVINLCARLATNGSQSDVSNSLSYASYIYNMDKSNMNYKDFCVSAIKTIDAKFIDETLQNYVLMNDSLILREKKRVD